MSPEPYICDLDIDTKTTLKVYLFTKVENVEDIRNNVIQGVWKCAVIKPTLILDPFQIAVAANRAVVAEKLGCMVTRTAYAEILYNLSLTKNITQSLSKFGVEKDHNLLVCFLITSEQDASADILPQIKGELRAISDLHCYTDVKELKNVYKVNKINFTSDSELLDTIVSRMVTKNFVSH